MRTRPLVRAVIAYTGVAPTACQAARRYLATRPDAGPYYNFKTLRQFPDGPPAPTGARGGTEEEEEEGREKAAPVRLYLSHRSGTADGLPLHNTRVQPDDDPYKNVRIFRRDMAEGGHSSHSSRPLALSVDVPLKRFQDSFCDYEGKRCKLCNESFLQWFSHQSSVPHSARECLALELVRAHCGTPEEIVRMWWHRLDTSAAFRRMPSLSHANSHVRKRRLQFLLKYLKDRDVVREAFNVRQQASSAGRTWEFERLEFLGDNVIKYLFNNRIVCLFPVSEGGTRGKIGLFQFLIDGNDGLARAHDFLELQQLTMSDRVVSKFKSDVVETLFGELQIFLWSSQLDLGTERVPHPFTKGMVGLRDLVYHVMEELAHVMIMYHIEYVLGSVQRVAREQQLQFVQTDPQVAPTGAKGGFSGRGGAANGVASSTLSGQCPAGLTLSAKSTPYRGTVPPGTLFDASASTSSRGHHGTMGGASGAAVYWEAMNYDKFAQATPLGGLLPRRFRVDELAPMATHLPHLQLDAALAARLPGNIAEDVGRHAAATRTTAAADDTAQLTLAPSPKASPPPQEALSVASLKDAELVAELV